MKGREWSHLCIKSRPYPSLLYDETIKYPFGRAHLSTLSRTHHCTCIRRNITLVKSLFTLLHLPSTSPLPALYTVLYNIPLVFYSVPFRTSRIAADIDWEISEAVTGAPLPAVSVSDRNRLAPSAGQVLPADSPKEAPKEANSAARECTRTAIAADSSTDRPATAPCATRAPTIPVRTSPLPGVAAQEEPVSSA